jgi:glycosyltransferase involved in cell wall biosynthesis
MKLSIVIPALNEERYLPALLESIRSQSFTDFEIIVADAGSKDSTRSIAESFGARIVDGGLPGAGRNAGARAAQGEYLFFFDSDVVLPQGFLELAVEELDERFIDLATCEIRPISPHTLDVLVHKFINASVRLSLKVDPKAMGFAIFVTRRLFNRAGGFDETIRMGEDAEFVKRAGKIRSLHWLNSVYLAVSVRRFEKEGRLTSIKKGIKLNLYRAFKGEVRTDVIDYEFAKYDSGPDEYSNTIVEKIERALMKLEKKGFVEIPASLEQVDGNLGEVTEDLKRFFTHQQTNETNEKSEAGNP